MCPKGYEEREGLLALSTPDGTSKLETLMLHCSVCSDGFYTLDKAEVNLTQTGNNNHRNAKCLPCPYGARCKEDIRTKRNYWGEAHDERISMYLCPKKYCCQSDSCTPYNMCPGNR